MAMGPRKKADFFNRGRGYEFESEVDDPPEVFPGHEPLLEAPGYEPEPSTSFRGRGNMLYQEPAYTGEGSSYEPQRQASYEVSQPGIDPGSAYHYSTPQYPGPSGYSLPSTVEASYRGDCGPLDSGSGTRQWSGGEEEGEKKKGKRSQTCRLCANHGRVVEMKGHKLYCPFQKPHDCAKCEITLQRRYFTAAQQRITRTQQMQLQEGHELPQAGVPSVNVNAREFPRLPELLQDCDDIIDESLFARINEVVRPRSHHPQ